MIIKTRYRKDRKPKIYCNGICFAVDKQGEEHVCREFDRYECECNTNEFDQYLGFERKVLDYKKFSDMEDKE